MGAVAVLVAAGSVLAAEPTTEEGQAAMRRAAALFHQEVASGGAYVWRYSADLKHRQGEAVATRTMLWVQPPGTPAVGDAFLDAYEATGDRYYLLAAQDAADPLIKGQLVSGGWYYHVELDPAKRGQFLYRVDFGVLQPPERADAEDYVGGWDVWKQRKKRAEHDHSR
jgi:hypothetical protein